MRFLLVVIVLAICAVGGYYLGYETARTKVIVREQRPAVLFVPQRGTPT